MIGKGEIIMGIVELYDALEASERERDGRRAAVVAEHGSDGGELSETDARMVEEGRAKVYGGCLRSWMKCEAARDDETGAVSVTPYEDWLKNKIGEVPDYMSRDEFVRYFADMLERDYERERQRAIAELAVGGDDE